MNAGEYYARMAAGWGAKRGNVSSGTEIPGGRAPRWGAADEQALRDEVGNELRALVHELNNPLAVMMGFTQLIQLNGLGDDKLRADLNKVYAEMKRMAGAVEKLHAYALWLQGRQSPRDGYMKIGA